MILSGFGTAILGALQTGFGALHRFSATMPEGGKLQERLGPPLAEPRRADGDCRPVPA